MVIDEFDYHLMIVTCTQGWVMIMIMAIGKWTTHMVVGGKRVEVLDFDFLASFLEGFFFVIVSVRCQGNGSDTALGFVTSTTITSTTITTTTTIQLQPILPTIASSLVLGKLGLFGWFGVDHFLASEFWLLPRNCSVVFGHLLILSGSPQFFEYL